MTLYDPEEEDRLDLSVIIPLMNEVGSLEELTVRVSEVVEDCGLSHEIVLVDDGSNDGSTKLIEQICAQRPEVKGIVFRRNFGKAQALEAGFQVARGELILTMDADLQDVPEEIPKLLGEIGRGYDLVSGWKQNRNDPLGKTLPSKLFNLVVSKMIGRRLHDFNCGFKLYRREILEDIQLYGELHRYVLVLAHARGFRVTEVPVKHHAREHGESKYGIERIPKGFFDLLTVLLTTRYFDRPLHFFGAAGLSMFSLGLLMLAGISVGWMFDQPIAGRPLFFLGILLVIVGGQVVSTGLLAEMLTKARHQNHNQFSVRRAINF
jgi:glycosyltransferase involved in cell wall biosynthesis